MRVVAKIKFYRSCKLSAFCRLNPILAIDNELYFYCHEQKYLLPVSIPQVIVETVDYKKPKELVVISEEHCLMHTKNEWFKLKMCDLFTLSYKLNKPISIDAEFLEKYGIKITKELLIRSLA